MGEYHTDPNRVHKLMNICQEWGNPMIWFVMDIVVLVPGLAVNLLLAWIFIRERKDMSPSKVLGVNLVFLQLLYLIISPVIMVIGQVLKLEGNGTEGNDGVFSLILIGCPLLLACMCMERYIAVAKPVLYLRGRKWEYKIAISVVIWAITLSVVCATVVLGFGRIILCASVLMCVLFCVMLACLAGVARSLVQRSPAHSNALPLSSPAPLKRRALRNVLVVTVPAIITYLPSVLLLPVALNAEASEAMCNLLNSITFFPSFAVFIGPSFYLTKAQQVVCARKRKQIRR